MEEQKQMSRGLRMALYAAALLPILLFRDFTPDNELRYLSIADEALADGHFFSFWNHGVIYTDKPPLYLWIVMLCRVVFGKHLMLPIGLFSLVPALVIALVMERWVTRWGEASHNAVICGELSMLTTLYFTGSALVLRMDMLMVMFIILALYTFWRMYQGKNSLKERIAFPIYIFLALFSKGPVGILVPMVAVPVFLAFRGELRTWGRYWGFLTWGILALLCAGWFTAVWFDGGSEYLRDLLFHQTIDRAVDAFHHKEPFWWYAGTFWYAAFPWSFIEVGVIAAALRRRVRFNALEQFFLLTAASFLIMMSAFSSKLAVYLLPVFPLLSYVTFMLLEKAGCGRTAGIMLWIPSVTYAAFLPAAVVLAAVKPAFMDGIAIWPAVIAFVLMTVAGVLAMVSLLGKNLRRAVVALASGLLVSVFSAGWMMPRYNSLFGWSDVCREAVDTAVREGVSSFGFHNLRRGENIDVLVGSPVERLDTIPASGKPIMVFSGEQGALKYRIYNQESPSGSEATSGLM